MEQRKTQKPHSEISDKYLKLPLLSLFLFCFRKRGLASPIKSELPRVQDTLFALYVFF